MGFFLLSFFAGGAAFFNGMMAARSWWVLLFFLFPLSYTSRSLNAELWSNFPRSFFFDSVFFRPAGDTSLMDCSFAAFPSVCQ